MRKPKTPERCLNLRILTNDTLRGLAMRDGMHIKAVATEALNLYGEAYPVKRDLPRFQRKSEAEPPQNTILHVTPADFDRVKQFGLRDGLPSYKVLEEASMLYAEEYHIPRKPPTSATPLRGRPPLNKNKEKKNASITA